MAETAPTPHTIQQGLTTYKISADMAETLHINHFKKNTRCLSRYGRDPHAYLYYFHWLKRVSWLSSSFEISDPNAQTSSLVQSYSSLFLNQRVHCDKKDFKANSLLQPVTQLLTILPFLIQDQSSLLSKKNSVRSSFKISRTLIYCATT